MQSSDLFKTRIGQFNVADRKCFQIWMLAQKPPVPTP